MWIRHLVLLLALGVAGCALLRPAPQQPAQALPAEPVPPDLAGQTNAAGERVTPVSAPGTAAEVDGRVTFSGGDGSSYANAIVIHVAAVDLTKLSSEFDYIADRHGSEGAGWQMIDGNTVARGDHMYDIIRIYLPAEKRKRVYFFDVTDLVRALNKAGFE